MSFFAPPSACTRAIIAITIASCPWTLAAQSPTVLLSSSAESPSIVGPAAVKGALEGLVPHSTAATPTQTTAAKAGNGKKGMWLGLGIGIAAGATFLAVECPQSSEPTDCARAGTLWIVPLFAAGGAVAGTIIDRKLR
jgi:hypothetical protein